MSENSARNTAWLAGILEGEGCFRVNFHRTRPTYRPQLVVKLKMADKDIIERAVSLVPAGEARIRPVKLYKSHHKLSYSFTWTGRYAEGLMRLVFWEMGQRRKEKIEECLNTPNLSHK